MFLNVMAPAQWHNSEMYQWVKYNVKLFMLQLFLLSCQNNAKGTCECEWSVPSSFKPAKSEMLEAVFAKPKPTHQACYLQIGDRGAREDCARARSCHSSELLSLLLLLHLHLCCLLLCPLLCLLCCLLLGELQLLLLQLDQLLLQKSNTSIISNGLHCRREMEMNPKLKRRTILYQTRAKIKYLKCNSLTQWLSVSNSYCFSWCPTTESAVRLITCMKC